MRRALLDINVLLALFDEDHVFHQRAHDWLGRHHALGWASCPLTENGFLRIRTHPNYHPSRRFSVTEMIGALQTFVHSGDHEFWCDDLSLRDAVHLNTRQIIGPRQIIDVYLLALATHHGGCLATFDHNVPIHAVPQSRPDNLCLIL